MGEGNFSFEATPSDAERTPDKESRSGLIQELDETAARQQKFKNQILPPLGKGKLPWHRALPSLMIETSDLAQKALLLEAHYEERYTNLLLGGFIKHHINIWSETADIEAAQFLIVKSGEMHARVQAVEERGDWRPIKEKWRKAISPMGNADQNKYDIHTTEKILELAPDQTEPIKVSWVDKDEYRLSK